MVVGFLTLFMVGCGCVQNYSEGERIGVVTKVSNKGLVFKSWEASALIALPSENGTMLPQQFNFTVEESAVKEIQDAAASGKRVKLIYREWWHPPVTIDNSYVVYRVEGL